MNRSPMIFIVLLSGCSLGPDYQRPELTLAEEFDAASVQLEQSPVGESASDFSVGPDPEDAWWHALHDPTLNKLIELAVAQNYSLQVASNRVREARALRRVASARLLPSVNGSGNGQRFSLSENSFGPLPALAREGLADLDGELFEAGFDASWEADIFGANRRSIETADASLEQSIAQRRAVMVSTIAEVARSYTELRGAQQRLEVLDNNIRIQQDTLVLVENRFTSGLASSLDVSRARAQLQGIRAQRPDIRLAIRRSWYQLAVLLAEQPGSESLSNLLELERLPETPDLVPAGLPAELVWRRNDVLAAEQALRAATAEVGVATAAFYPKFFLTGSLTQEGIRFSDLYEAASQAWTLGPLIQWPLFQGGALRANKTAATIRMESAYANFQQAVLVALQDVETQLVGFAESRLKVNELEAATQSSERSVELALVLYERGLEDYLTVLDAERILAQQQDLLVLGETENVLSTIALYKSLGGGWQVFEVKE